MKCPDCHSLNCADDEVCSGCRKPLAPAREAAAKEAAKAATPQWAYFFAAVCGAIPFVTLGGAIPGAIGFGGAGACLGVARAKGVGMPLRVIACLGITVVCWLALVTFLIEFNPALKAKFYKTMHH